MQVKRNFSDFIEDESTPMSGLETADRFLDGAGEGPFGVSEKFAGKESIGQGAARDRDQRLLFPLAVVMNRFGDQVLSRAALALNQNGSIGFDNSPDNLKNLKHLRMGPNDIGKRKFLRYFLPKVVKLPFHLLGLESLPDDGDEPFQVGEDRLFKKIKSALFQGFYGQGHRPVGGDEDDGDLGVTFLDLEEELHAVQIRHSFVGDEEVDRIGLDFFQGFFSVSGGDCLQPFLVQAPGRFQRGSWAHHRRREYSASSCRPPPGTLRFRSRRQLDFYGRPVPFLALDGNFSPMAFGYDAVTNGQTQTGSAEFGCKKRGE